MQKTLPKKYQKWLKKNPNPNTFRQRSLGWSVGYRRELRSVASRPYKGVKPKSGFPRKGHRGDLQAKKKKTYFGMEGESRDAGSSPREEPGFLFTAPALPPSLRHHIPFRASEERGKFFLFWVLRAPGCGWKGAAAARRSPNGDELPLPPCFFWAKGRKSPKEKGCQRANCPIGCSTSAARRRLHFPAPSLPQFPRSEPTYFLRARHELRFKSKALFENPKWDRINSPAPPRTRGRRISALSAFQHEPAAAPAVAFRPDGIFQSFINKSDPRSIPALKITFLKLFPASLQPRCRGSPATLAAPRRERGRALAFAELPGRCAAQIQQKNPPK